MKKPLKFNQEEPNLMATFYIGALLGIVLTVLWMF